MPSIDTLAEQILKRSPGEGSHATAIKDLFLTHYTTTAVPRTSLQQPVFCIVAQGAKSILLQEQRFVYDPNSFLLVSVDLPLVGQIDKASRAEPFLGISLVLDLAEIASLLRDADFSHQPTPPLRSGLVVGALQDDLLDAVHRLVALLDKPEQIAILAPLIRREIYYKLLLSESGGMLRSMAAEGGRVQRVAEGLAWLRRNATRPIRMEQLARHMGMSASAMHSWFRAVTAMSPLQYQKQLRLQEARRLLLLGGGDAATVSRQVGYESPSQFSREYRRFFGAPPMQDMQRLRAVAHPVLP